MLPGVVDIPDLVIPARKASLSKIAVPKPDAGPVAASAPGAASPQAAPPPAPAPPGARPRAPLSAARQQAGREEKANNAFNDPGARTFEEDEDLNGGSLDLDLKGPPLIDTL
jgi:hypothetical protein